MLVFPFFLLVFDAAPPPLSAPALRSLLELLSTLHLILVAAYLATAAVAPGLGHPLVRVDERPRPVLAVVEFVGEAFEGLLFEVLPRAVNREAEEVPGAADGAELVVRRMHDQERVSHLLERGQCFHRSAEHGPD